MCDKPLMRRQPVLNMNKICIFSSPLLGSRDFVGNFNASYFYGCYFLIDCMLVIFMYVIFMFAIYSPDCIQRS